MPTNAYIPERVSPYINGLTPFDPVQGWCKLGAGPVRNGWNAYVGRYGYMNGCSP